MHGMVKVLESEGSLARDAMHGMVKVQESEGSLACDAWYGEGARERVFACM